MPERVEPEADNVRKLRGLLDVLRRVQAKAKDARALGQAIESSADLIGEIAAASQELMSLVSAGELRGDDLDRQIESWEDWLRSVDELTKVATPQANVFSVASSYATNTTSTVAAFITVYPRSPTAPKIGAARTKIDQILARSGFLERVRTEMVRLGLDRRGGDNKSPLALLDDAAAGLSTSAGAALMPMRGSINATLGELLRRRPRHDRTPKVKEKLNSIGSQCARPGLAVDYFDHLAVDGSILIDQLAAAKEGDLRKEQVSSLFHRSLVFMHAFLSSLDETLLRPA